MLVFINLLKNSVYRNNGNFRFINKTLLGIFLISQINLINAQTDTSGYKPTGIFFGKFYFNYHLHLNDTAKSNGVFESTRCLAGYDYSINPKLDAVLAIDVASTSTSAYTLIVKCAYVNWEVLKPLKLMIGIFDMTQFNTQEKHWGYRHVLKSFQDEYGFGASNDAGINAELTFNKKIKANLFVVNGEGNKKLQDEFGMHRFGANVVVKPINGLTLKVAGDMNPCKYGKFEYEWGVHDTSTIYLYSAFAGYKFKEKFSVGAEFNQLLNGVKYTLTAQDYNLQGISLYATYFINKKWEIFARYDHLESNRPGLAALPWNVAFDGDLYLGGIQYTHVKGFNIALNYRSWLYRDKTQKENSFIYLNFNYSF